MCVICFTSFPVFQLKLSSFSFSAIYVLSSIVISCTMNVARHCQVDEMKLYSTVSILFRRLHYSASLFNAFILPAISNTTRPSFAAFVAFTTEKHLKLRKQPMPITTPQSTRPLKWVTVVRVVHFGRRIFFDSHGWRIYHASVKITTESGTDTCA